MNCVSMNLKEGLLLLGVLVALLCVPAAVAAADGDAYIKVVLDKPKEYLNLNITTMDALDPLDIGKTSVTSRALGQAAPRPSRAHCLGISPGCSTRRADTTTGQMSP